MPLYTGTRYVLLGAAAAAAAAGGGSDPNFASVVFLSGFEGADAATSLTSEDVAARTATFVGNAQLDTAQFKFGASSLLLDGTGDYITFPDSSDFNFDAQFTIEGWAMRGSANATAGIVMGFYDGAGARGWKFAWTTSTHIWTFNFSTDGSTNAFGPTGDAGAAADSTWYHWAVDRDGSDKMRVYVGGTMIGSQTSASGTSFNGTQLLRFGMQDTSIFPFLGWIDEVRITKGVARYASDSGFTAPTAAFPRS